MHEVEAQKHSIQDPLAGLFTVLDISYPGHTRIPGFLNEVAHVALFHIFEEYPNYVLMVENFFAVN